MRFVPWYPLVRAAEHAPAAPGVFQVRVRHGLVDYPRGKSAMVHYGAGRDVCAAASAFAKAHPHVDWLCRHAVELSAAEAADPAAACRMLVERFHSRFGTPPKVSS